MRTIKTYEQFINEGYYDDINGWISTSQNKSGFKEGETVKGQNGEQGSVYDVLVSPDEKDFCVVVKWKNANGNTSIGKYGPQHNDISYISK